MSVLFNAANSASANAEAPAAAKTFDNAEGEELTKKKGIPLMQKVSRVTVILPPKNMSEKTQSNNPL